MNMMASVTATAPAADDLYHAIGAFLDAHRLTPEPAHYAFAYQVVAKPDGSAARAVASILASGVQLSQDDIDTLGDPAGLEPDGGVRGIAARAQVQVDRFADLMHAIQGDTRAFGRDLEASLAALADAGGTRTIGRIADVTTAMLGRVRDTDARLAVANAEVDVARIRTMKCI